MSAMPAIMLGLTVGNLIIAMVTKRWDDIANVLFLAVATWIVYLSANPDID